MKTRKPDYNRRNDLIRRAVLNDAEQICGIYNYYVDNTVITFEEEDVTADEMKRRIADVTETLPWIVYESDGKILGYAYASKWKVRSAYRYSVESTVYVEHGSAGRGIGTALYTELIETLRHSDIHAVVACLALPNDESSRLHERFGFEKTGYFKEVGFKFDRWLDIGYYQLLL